MSGHQTATVDDTVYFWFAANDTSGSGGDGATPLFDVREAGAAASAIPLLSGTPTLLTHANYPAGCHEIAVAATTGNGFAADDTFAVFCTLAIDSQNPSGFVGSCTLTPLAKAAALTTVDTVVDGIQTDLSNGTDGLGAIKADTAAILVDTGTTLQAELDAIQAAVITNAAGVDIAADIIALKAETALIVGDTNELQTDWADAGRLDAILDARASQATADAIETDTQDIQGRLPAALSGGNMKSDMLAISTSTDAADKLEASTETMVIGTAQTGTLSTTVMTSDVTEATADHFIGRIIIWTSGALIRQATDITDYSGTNGTFTFTAVTEAPSNGDTFIVV